MKKDTAATGIDIPFETKRVVLQVAELLKDKKAEDVLVLDLGNLTSITDYFIIATVNSSTQAKALVRDIEEYMKAHRIEAFSKNDEYESPWVLLDYNYFIIHLFRQEGRGYYQLEKLWSDAPVVWEDRGGML
jgi:ribosome-associated protein